MNNEQDHINDLLEPILSQGGTHHWLGAAFEVVGKVFGFVTTLFGKSFVFKADIKVEQKAVKDYGAFLDTINFDEKSKKLIAKNLEDEKVHIERWNDSLDILTKQSA
jgi:bacterioferritin (cytochrome b1)